MKNENLRLICLLFNKTRGFLNSLSYVFIACNKQHKYQILSSGLSEIVSVSIADVVERSVKE